MGKRIDWKKKALEAEAMVVRLDRVALAMNRVTIKQKEQIEKLKKRLKKK